MSTYNENKVATRKAITSLINLLKAESDIIGKENPISVAKTEHWMKLLNDLQHQLSIYSYLEANPENEQNMPEKEPVIVPSPLIYTPAVQFEKAPVELPKIPTILPEKEIPTRIIAPKSFPELKSFIGLNEKLMFLRLFNNDGDEYDKALTQISACSTIEDAKKVVANFSEKNKWNRESEAVQVFLSIVNRRFI